MALQVYRTNDKTLWRVFRQHHYLSAELNVAADCYLICLNNTMVGFLGVLPFPSGVIKYAYRVSRVVILPDYQNLNFGTKFIEFIGDYYLNQGCKYYIRSSHLRLKNHCQKSNKWVECSNSGKVSGFSQDSVDRGVTKIILGKKDKELNRIAFSFEYMGHDFANKSNFTLYVDDTKSIDVKIVKNDLKKLKNKYWLKLYTGEIHFSNPIELICKELGIRTELLYSTKYKNIKINSQAKKEFLLTKWDNQLYNYLKNGNLNEVPKHYFEKIQNEKIDELKQNFSLKKEELW